MNKDTFVDFVTEIYREGSLIEAAELKGSIQIIGLGNFPDYSSPSISSSPSSTTTSWSFYRFFAYIEMLFNSCNFA